MKALAAMFLLGAVLPGPSYACSGTAVADVPAGSGFMSIVRGQHYDDLDHLLRNKADGSVLVCAADRCFPAITAEGGGLAETMRLQGCRVATAATLEHGMERHEIDTPGFDRQPDQGDEAPGVPDRGTEPD